VGRALAAVVVLGVVVAVLAFGFGWWQFSRIERVDVGPVLSSPSTGTNYLVVGSDSRAAIDPNAPDAGAFLAGPAAGERADTIIVLRVGDGPARMLSIPRDLWVTYPTSGEEGRINGAFAQGPGALVAAVSQIGIPIDHYLQIDFVSFAGLVDAVGGIQVEFPNPAFDEMSGLAVDTAGSVTLDGSQALAYVRSRQYTEVIDGASITDPTGDIGRTQRQRAFLTALFGKLGATRNPVALRSAASALAPGMAIDDTLTYLDALGLVLRVRGLSSASEELPVYPFTTSGGAAVLGLSEPDASAVIAGFN
jgi:LCP family protein required for cell wall assembly